MDAENQQFRIPLLPLIFYLQVVFVLVYVVYLADQEGATYGPRATSGKFF